MIQFALQRADLGFMTLLQKNKQYMLPKSFISNTFHVINSTFNRGGVEILVKIVHRAPLWLPKSAAKCMCSDFRR